MRPPAKRARVVMHPILELAHTAIHCTNVSIDTQVSEVRDDGRSWMNCYQRAVDTIVQ